MKKLLSSSFVLIIFGSAIIFVQLSGCQKVDAEVPTKQSCPVYGMWAGSYTTNQPVAGEPYYSFIIKPDGSLIVETKNFGNQYLAVGNWTLKDSTLTCIYTYIYASKPGDNGTIQTATAIWDGSSKTQTGTWMNTSPNNGAKGTFKLSRVPDCGSSNY